MDYINLRFINFLYIYTLQVIHYPLKSSVEDKSSDLSDILKPFKDEISKVLNQNQEIKMIKQEPTISFSSNNNKIIKIIKITPQSTNIIDTNQNNQNNQNIKSQIITNEDQQNNSSNQSK